tara:strand:- start:596 stop:1039 length:444 start_codon:yes stop_codon:yes gene_type:complete
VAKLGRPTTYTDELANEIVKRLSEGESLLAICRDQHMPDRSTIHDWVLGITGGIPDDFSRNYTRAREMQAEVYFDQVVTISDETDDAPLGRLRTDSRKWVLARMNRAKYGDRTEVGLQGGGEGSGEIRFTWKTSASESPEDSDQGGE